MSGLKSILFIVVLIVAGVFVYRYLRRVPLSPEQFHSISHLTPDDLRARCGHPEQDTSGVVVEDDGIRDLRYRDAGGAELVFRFISEDGVNWQSLGAWEQVNAPDDLGAPLATTEAVRRLPCAATIDTATSSLSLPPERRQPDGVASDLAVILQDFPIMQPHPVPLPTPTIPAPAIRTPAHTPLSSSMPSPVPYPGQARSREPGSGPGSDGTRAHAPMIVPCPSVREPCELLQYAQFVAEFHQAIQAEHDNDFEQAMNRLTEHGVMMVQLPSLEVSRAQAVKAVVQLELRAINIVEARLRDDVAHLEPPSLQSDQVKQKMTVVEHDDLERRQMWKRAVESNRPAVSASTTSSGSTMRFNSDAYQQLVQIHLTGNWP